MKRVTFAQLRELDAQAADAYLARFSDARKAQLDMIDVWHDFYFDPRAPNWDTVIVARDNYIDLARKDPVELEWAPEAGEWLVCYQLEPTASAKATSP